MKIAVICKVKRCEHCLCLSKKNNIGLYQFDYNYEIICSYVFHLLKYSCNLNLLKDLQKS